ncbi:MAG: lipase/acyltransferase domain-containing protein, partial [Thermoanaerobaculia bacterium]
MPKPAIFIPGFPASELLDETTHAKLFPPNPLDLLNPARKKALLDKLSVVEGVIAGDPIEATIRILKPAAQTLYDLLKNDYGYDDTTLVPIGWDWRQSISSDDTVARIKKALDKLSPNKDGKVVAILHSTGGLVFRAFLERAPEYLTCFDQVLTFGIPWCGTLEALHAVYAGAPINIGPIPILSADDSKRIVQNAQAAYDLFPRCPDMNLFISNGASTTPIDDQSWIPPDAAHDFMRALAAKAHPRFPQAFDALPLTSVCGWGGDTWPVCTNVGGTLTFPKPENDKGDGTVNFPSASWLTGKDVRQMPVPVGAYADEGLIPQYHGQLWMPKVVRQLFNEVLKDAEKQPFVAAAADKDQYIDPNAARVRIRIVAVDGDGKPLENAVLSFKNGPQSESHPFTGPRMDFD